ncbi:hypothetical protein [Natronoglomus mannanivorans]|uniref:Tail terminator n=1 Tax=Natronoglomus mannanivorans TaxID=2979990 RepID=A0AAP2Z233_9EURY|nr:hypothetical protein [Halobacteria archaeon AArc-xg1-1]
MSQNPTIPAGDLTTEVIQNGFRAELQSYADEEGTPLEDPLAPRGDKTPAFVLTSEPSTNPRYPHIIVEESDDSAAPIDRRQSAFIQHDFAVMITVEARSSTEKFALKDAVRHFLQAREDALRDRGFAEPTISATPADWDSTSSTSSWQATVSGLVHTTDDPPQTTDE